VGGKRTLNIAFGPGILVDRSMKFLIGILAVAVSVSPALVADTTVPICELLQHPEQYDGKRVQTQRRTVAGNSGCPSAITLWVESGKFGADLGAPAPGGANVTVSGIFHWNPGSDTPAILNEAPTIKP